MTTEHYLIGRSSYRAARSSTATDRRMSLHRRRSSQLQQLEQKQFLGVDNLSNASRHQQIDDRKSSAISQHDSSDDDKESEVQMARFGP